MSLQEHKKAYRVYDLLFHGQQCITIISSRKMCIFISSVFKEIIPSNDTPTFQLNPAYFVDCIRFSHGIALTITKLIDFYSQCVFTFLFATVFN